MAEPSKIFICYSRADQVWKRRVETALMSLERRGFTKEQVRVRNTQNRGRFSYELWSDEKIKLGSNWKEDIDAAIRASRFAILLVSPEFLASDFIFNEELPRFLDREDDGLILVSLILRHCLWRETQWLAETQFFPADGVPLAALTESEHEEKLADFMREVDALLEADKGSEDPQEEDLTADTPTEEKTALTKEDAANPALLHEPGSEFLNYLGVRDLINRSSRTTGGEEVVGEVNIFRTKRQRTWIAATRRELLCILDGANTRARDRLIQWRMPLGEKINITMRPRDAKRKTGLVDIGKRRNWLYTKRIFKSPKNVKQKLEELIEKAERP